LNVTLELEGSFAIVIWNVNVCDIGNEPNF
jgi:hypothetical protein